MAANLGMASNLDRLPPELLNRVFSLALPANQQVQLYAVSPALCRTASRSRKTTLPIWRGQNTFVLYDKNNISRKTLTERPGISHMQRLRIISSVYRYKMADDEMDCGKGLDLEINGTEWSFRIVEFEYEKPNKKFGFEPAAFVSKNDVDMVRERIKLIVGLLQDVLGRELTQTFMAEKLQLVA